MAVSGSATSAYRVQIIGGELQVRATTSMSYMCIVPALAIETITTSDDSCVIAGSDMPEFWRLWREVAR